MIQYSAGIGAMGAMGAVGAAGPVGIIPPAAQHGFDGPMGPNPGPPHGGGGGGAWLCTCVCLQPSPNRAMEPLPSDANTASVTAIYY